MLYLYNKIAARASLSWFGFFVQTVKNSGIILDQSEYDLCDESVPGTCEVALIHI